MSSVRAIRLGGNLNLTDTTMRILIDVISSRNCNANLEVLHFGQAKLEDPTLHKQLENAIWQSPLHALPGNVTQLVLEGAAAAVVGGSDGLASTALPAEGKCLAHSARDTARRLPAQAPALHLSPRSVSSMCGYFSLGFRCLRLFLSLTTPATPSQSQRVGIS
eukprot:COSAG05_NODE_2842_length_2581_cov_1.939968_3_plen_163_part_00